MPSMGLVDSGFLLLESREHPMHVGGLQLFTPPDGEGPNYVYDQIARAMAEHGVNRRFSLRPAEPVGVLGNFRWVVEKDVDLGHHVRRSAVPSPGRLRELFELTSRWQGSLLDRHRPLWEVHIVEGLADGRVAIYTKVHHALVDGISAIRLMQQYCSPDPSRTDCLPVWVVPEEDSGPAAPQEPEGLLPSVAGWVNTGGAIAEQLFTLGPKALKVAHSSLRDTGLTTPFDAPKTMLNGPIGGARRFVAQRFEIDRFRRVQRASRTTFNDVVLAVCGAALRDYLIEQDGLPEQSLTAMCPVNLRRSGSSAGGNSLGAMIASLATDVLDPAERLETISASTTMAKKTMRDLSPVQLLLMSGYNIAGLGLEAIPGFSRIGRPPFNVVISNVPGPRRRLYFNGAELDGTYPASIPVDGLAVNITLITYDDSVDVGITACRASAPSVQRLIHHMESALAGLESAYR